MLPPRITLVPASRRACAILVGLAAAAASAEDGELLAAKANDAWFVNLDVQWLARGNGPHSQTLAGHNNGTPGAPADDRSALNADGLRFDGVLEPGVGVGYRLDDAWSFQLSYFGVSSMNDRANASGPADLDVPFTSAYADFTNADRVSVRYESELRDLQVNLGYRPNQYASYVIGVGYVGLFEDFRLRSQSTQTSTYSTSTDNNLLGVNVGTDATLPLGDHWALTASGRIGAFNNHVQYSQMLGNFGDSVTLRDSTDRENTFAWRGEIGVAASYTVTRQWTAWAGYNLSYVDNVYLAPDQVDFGTSAGSGSSLSRESSAFYHGPTLGLVYTFP